MKKYRIFAINDKMRTKAIPNLSSERHRLAELMDAIAHPARMAILQILAERKSCICGEIVNELPLAQATVSQHLKVLKDAGLIQGIIDGPRVCYCLNPAGIAELKHSMSVFMQNFDSLESMNETCSV
jgi:ArsR family transcriptional regulator